MTNHGSLIHPMALVDKEAHIGGGTRIWAFAQVMSGAIVGDNCNIGGQTFLETGCRIGNNVTIKNQVMIWDGVTIHDDVFVGPGVIFTNDNQPRSPRMQYVQNRYESKKNWLISTIVKRGATIGAGSIILPIEIGEYAFVAAGATVTKNVKSHSIVAGNPARVIGWVCKCGLSFKTNLNCDQCGFIFKSNSEFNA